MKRIKKKKKFSYYRRELPISCIALDSKKGKEIFKSALYNGGAENFFKLVSNHHTQSEPAWCAFGSLVVALNALSVDPQRKWKGVWR
jgi:glutathione gamma-glutamylcysteinyltransferase